MASDVEICSTALRLIGAEKIDAFEDESREARVCSSIYTSFLKSLLQSGVWRFAMGQAELSKLTAVPLFGFTNAFQLPANYLRLIGKNNPALKHQIFEDKLYANANAILVNYQFRPAEATFPSYFEKTLYLQLAEVLAVAIPEDEAKSKLYGGLATKQLIMARTVDAQSDGDHEPPEDKFRLTAIRH